MHRRTLLIAAANASIGALLAACGSSSATAPPNATAPATTRAATASATTAPAATTGAASTTIAPSAVSGKAPSTVQLAISYIPNVQFANFYMADAKGRFAAEGVKVEYD